MNTTLLIMAAGIGSRFGKGIKQLEPVDDAGHIIMDYSIHDAIEAGFNHVVFIVRKDIEQEFKEVIGERIKAICSAHDVTVDYAFQDINDIPGTLPEGRTKPWGTGQAVLVAKELLKTPFIVINHFHKNDCFHSCEGQHCMGTDHWMQAVIELLHQHKCKSHAPPKRFYESQPPDSLVTTTQIAKEYGCGAKVFNRLLHLHGIQYRANNQWVLYAKHQDKGYTANLVFRLHRSDGSAVEKLHTAWTHKGRKFLYHELKRRGILPMAEQEG